MKTILTIASVCSLLFASSVSVASTEEAPLIPPFDPMYEQQWVLSNTGQDGAFEDIDINAEAAWNIRTDAKDVVVAIISTGIKTDHPDLQTNIWINRDEIADNGIDDDGNGYIDDIHGYNFIDRNANNDDLFKPFYSVPSGTEIAGAIGAVGANGVGIRGVAWKVQLMGLKVDYRDHDYPIAQLKASAIVEAIEYAIDNGANIIVMEDIVTTYRSWMIPMPATPYIGLVLRDAIQKAKAANVLVVTKARTTFDGVAYPSGFVDSNVISATNISDFLNKDPRFSNAIVAYDIYIPGGKSLTTSIEPLYEENISLAAGYVAGAAALIMAENPALSAAEVRQQLILNVRPDNRFDTALNSGWLNVHDALRLPGQKEYQQYATTVNQHIEAKRAYPCGFADMLGCAIGSDTQLGWRASALPVTVCQQSTYHVVNGSCPDQSGEANHPPVINLNGDSAITLEFGEPFIDPGATATDFEDQDISYAITTTGTVNSHQYGSYLIRYDVVDGQGQPAATEYRIVTVSHQENTKESNKPLVGLIYRSDKHLSSAYSENDLLSYIHLREPFSEPGYYAFDKFDGNISDRVEVYGEVDTSIAGDNYLYYSVTNSVGTSVDNENRRIVLVLDDCPQLYQRSTYFERDDSPYEKTAFAGSPQSNSPPRLLAFDIKDGYEVEITVDGEHDPLVPGDYRYVYTATDTDGNTDTQEVWLHILADDIPPVITLQGEAEITLRAGESFNDPGTEVSDNSGSFHLNDEVVVEGEVDNNTPGDYVLTYRVSDGAGNEAEPVTRVVHVIPVDNCKAYSATAQNHIDEGRATACGWFNMFACTVPGGESIGYRFGWLPVVIKEEPVGSGNFRPGSCQ